MRRAHTHAISQSCTNVFALLALVVATLVEGQVCPSLLQRGSHAQRLATSPRLRLVTVTGTSVAERAKQMLKVVKPTMTDADSIVHICDPGCDSALNGSLGDITEMPDTVFPGDRCTMCLKTPKTIAEAEQNPQKWISASGIECPNSEKAYECPGKIKAQMKFVWGLIHEVKVAMASQEQVPEWWMLRDDDTYVNVDAVMEALSSYNPDDLVYAGHPGGNPMLPPDQQTVDCMHGGFGMLVSRGLAKKLATEYADMWKSKEWHGMHYDEGYLYDFIMGIVAFSVPNVTLDYTNSGVLNNTAHGEYCLGDAQKGRPMTANCKNAMPYVHYCLQRAGNC